MIDARAWFPDWQDKENYAHLDHIDRAGLMWEWLRRDPAYVAWHACASAATCGNGSSSRIDEDVAQWGIHFRRTAGARSPGRSDPVARRA